jgi:hypothetical protein
VVVLRREVYEQRPWLAETAAGASLLPWAYAEAERTRPSCSRRRPARLS